MKTWNVVKFDFYFALKYMDLCMLNILSYVEEFVLGDIVNIML